MEDAEYHRCVAYGKGAEVLGKYLVKGKRVYIEGRLRTRRQQDSEGIEKFFTEIIVDNFIFLDSRGEGQPENTETTYVSESENVWSDDLMTEEIPF